jgi:hypothetical protein
MLQNSHLKAILKERRVLYMKFMKHCLERFKETNDDFYWNWAMKFGEWSKETQKELDGLST